jgi:hypothetical protein
VLAQCIDHDESHRNQRYRSLAGDFRPIYNDQTHQQLRLLRNFTLKPPPGQ